MTTTMTTSINRQKIIDDMSKIEVAGDERGLIEGFNVFVQQLPARFWNSFADRLVNKVEPEVVEATEYLLVNAAHECGYHTGYGGLAPEIRSTSNEGFPEHMIGVLLI